MSIRNSVFGGYLVRFNTNDLKHFQQKLSEYFNKLWTIEEVDESFKIYHAYPKNKEILSVTQIWDFLHSNQTESIRYIDPVFKSVEVDEVQIFDYKCDAHPNGTENKYWCIDQMNIRQAWDHSLKMKRPAYGSGIKIGHTDTGYTKHESIHHSQLLVSEGGNVFEGGSDAYDLAIGQRSLANRGHGTSTASCIIGNGKHNVHGIAPHAYIVPIRVADGVLVEEKNFIKGIAHAIRRGCLITSSSLAVIRLDDYSQAIEDILQEALREGIIPFGAGGQAIGVPGFLKDIYPSKSTYCISCTASTIFKYPWRKAFGTHYLEIGAPGESVNIATVNSGNEISLTERSCGTSFATAFMAGVAALWYAHHGVQHLHDTYGKRKIFYIFKSLLRSYGTVCPPGWNTAEYGPGIVDAYSLIKAPLPESLDNFESIEKEAADCKNYRIEKITELLKIKISDIHPLIHRELENDVHLQQELLFHLNTNTEKKYSYKKLLNKTGAIPDTLINNFSLKLKHLLS